MDADKFYRGSGVTYSFDSDHVKQVVRCLRNGLTSKLESEIKLKLSLCSKGHMLVSIYQERVDSKYNPFNRHEIIRKLCDHIDASELGK